jgi:glycosyltransferase involved in cell wall biosynthesis
MPNVVIEAMACRVPVIATATAGAARELLGDGIRGELVDRPEAALIADALRDRFSNPSRWLARIEPARQYVERTHALPRWLEQMQSIFHDVVAHRRRR